MVAGLVVAVVVVVGAVMLRAIVMMDLGVAVAGSVEAVESSGPGDIIGHCRGESRGG